MERKSVVLRLEKICKSFGGVEVLLDVGVDLYQEEILGLTGPEGARKSTLYGFPNQIH